MTTLDSSSPSNGPRAHLAGFNEHRDDDPVLPSPPNKEELLQIISPLPQSSYTSPSFSNADLSTAASKSSSADPLRQLRYHQGQHIPPAFHSTGISPPQSHTVSPPSVTSNTFLSPAAAYYSDNGYSELSEITTPSFDDDLFGLEADFGPLAAIPEDLEHLRGSIGFERSELVDLDTFKSYQLDQMHPPLFGAATPSHLSQMGNHVWARSATLRSRDGGESAPTENLCFEKGDPDQSTIPHLAESTLQSVTPGHLRQPVELTGDSNSTFPASEDPHTVQHMSSPVVRVESYSRGDSPARATPNLGRSGSKRSRTGHSPSHLHAKTDSDASQEDEQAGMYDTAPASLAACDDQYNIHSGLTNDENRIGWDPVSRGPLSDKYVPNFKDQEESAEAAQKLAEVEDWLAHSAAGSEAGDSSNIPSKTRGGKDPRGRRRARSMVNVGRSKASIEPVSDPAFRGHDDSKIPGPGLLLEEDSGDAEEDAEDSEETTPESPPAAIDINRGLHETTESYFPPIQEEPLPHQFYYTRPWQDPPECPSIPEIKMQPETSNAAIMQFRQRAADIETASRVATWGTRRRLSEADVEKVLGAGGLFQRMSVGKDHDRNKEKGEKRGSFFEQAAAKLMPRRSSNTLRRNGSEPSKQQMAAPTSTIFDQPGKGSPESASAPHGNLAVFDRRPSTSKRPKSPKINTSSAVAAMTSQIAAIGGSGSISATATSPPPGPWASARNAMKRTRSRSELKGSTSRSTADLGIAEMWNMSGGPPMPTLASPPIEKVSTELTAMVDENDEDADHDETMDEKGVAMDLTIRPDLIIPNLDGFKSNVRQLNPRLVPFMIERIGQEQLRRYKKLTEFKVNHLKATNAGRCGSGQLCPTLGGEPVYLPAKAGAKDPEMSHTGFSFASIAPSDDETNALAEGIVTAAQFPPGVPMPPVKRLPAEFECYLCFKVKKFHKPSDWSKHVHEDVQPFTCTFAQCSEPKSFKRKADWVRHENERHRQLEWWTCNIQDCTHTCYRKDNFVQHLVREHKLPEPKVKLPKPAKPAVRGPANHKSRTAKLQMDPEDWNEDSSALWRIVDERRHITEKNPREEPCKFCGNVCNSWKKLTVHLAKHMEQISMPILTLVKEKDVTPDTIISPIEQRIPQQSKASPMQGTIMSRVEPRKTSLSNQSASLSPVSEDLTVSVNPSQTPTNYYMPTRQNQAMHAWQPVPSSDHSGQLDSQSPTMHYTEGATAAYSAPPYPAYDHASISQPMPMSVPISFPQPRSVPSQFSVYEQARSQRLPPTLTGYQESHAYMPVLGLQAQQQPPVETLYHFSDSVSPPYFQQPTLGAPTSAQYHGFPAMPYTQAVNDASLYRLQRQQDYPYNQ
ncbi:MAG: hypothetical protein LQ347_001554 [Umbilicaria vellea]|nr:MAG: hypothetical protein LQ347_001554 [Umbilicaria vellea]